MSCPFSIDVALSLCGMACEPFGCVTLVCAIVEFAIIATVTRQYKYLERFIFSVINI
jgi:hypothetical protein